MSEKTEVLYNASCPICRREVDHYARISAREDLPIGYHDLGDAEQLADWGMTEKDAAMRLHVRKDGQVFGGIPAFVVLWREIPRMRWLARVVSLPGIHWIACIVYDHILAPVLYRWHLARMARRSR
jgi:predicted DCC family thiol-disulfide oxidoreductase YuxK